MNEIYLVTAGTYTDYHVVRAFSDEATARQWVLAYNNTHPWRHDDDKARVESVPLTPVGQQPPAP